MLSENLYKLRKLHKLSQEEVADKIGVSRQAVAKWESGDTLPDIQNCSSLARLYEVSLDDLVNFEGDSFGGFPVPPKGKYVFGTVTVGERGQVVIPVKARKVFGYKPGDELIVLGDEKQNGIALMKADYIVEMMRAIREEIS